ncbi:tetratricopeptide repeat protein [Alkalilimnicola sp. S0819]|uniref:tetratricopeptide repeat protein n=1 Tax=Alkalilimnicola sp. S0819 TaxID=2613922 RepID=UPI0012626563|nr:tetratricopeptide repeat protein [Alkalilimnicola sp. S0819]KAB7623784.1 tetratricopeptide repeat protein [Alkalilimnicola sp. S0819]MPQ16657.1 tetratricopeptide repeat protein [Alkalilimnicola sp. S0819]
MIELPRMLRTRRPSLITLLAPALALGLAACAGPQPREAAAPAPEPAAEAPPRSADADLMLKLLAAEMALREQDAGAALGYYREAMALSNSPRVASRTAQLARYLGRDELVREAAERWRVWAPEDPQPLRLLGLLRLEAGAQAEALALLAEFVEGSGATAEAFEQLLADLRQSSAADRSLAVGEALAERFPDSPDAQLALGRLALWEQRYALVDEAAARALALRPDWRDAWFLRAEAQRRSGDEVAALETLDQALKSQPADYELRLQYARGLLGAGFSEQALAQFRRLLRQRPADARVLYAAGLLALETGEPEQARGYLLKLLELGEQTDAAQYFLGRLAESEGDLEGALRWYGRVQGGEYQARAQLRRPAVLAAEGNLAGARKMLAELRNAQPELAMQAWLGEVALLREAGARDEARAMLDQALERHPGEPDLLYSRALMAAEAGDVARAEEDLRAVLAGNPDNARALNALGYTLVDLTERVEEGFALIRRAYQGAPDDPAVIDSMGWAHYRMGELEQALDYLSRAYELYPDQEVGAHLGEVLWQLGRREEARAIWRAVLERDSASPAVRETMERLTR